MQRKVEICGVNTSKLKVLKNDEIQELLRKTQEGDKQARDTLIQGNLRLVLSVIHRFDRRGDCADDLFQVGCVGLMKAIDNFDLTLGVRFSTYAVPMIQGELRRYLRDDAPMRVSRSIRDTAYKVLQAKEQYVSAHQREPSMEELAKILEMKESEIVYALDAISQPMSLYEPVFTDKGDSLTVMDQVRDTKNSDERWTEDIALHEAMDKLNEREKQILSLRFFQGKTQMEVSTEVGISQAQVSRLEKNALKQMRKTLEQ